MQHSTTSAPKCFAMVGTVWRAAERQRSEKSMGNRILSNENTVASFLFGRGLLPTGPFGFGYSLAKPADSPMSARIG